MSLEIDTDRVTRILLPDQKWHDIIAGSFDTDAYEYMEGTNTIFAGGQSKETIPSTGATWREKSGDGNETTFFCPLTSILAVSYA